jgi:hypothetical protein
MGSSKFKLTVTERMRADGWVTCHLSLRHTITCVFIQVDGSRSTLRSTYNVQVSTGTRPFRINLILSPEVSLEDIELSIGRVIVTGFYDLPVTSVRSCQWVVFPRPLSFLRRIGSLH